MGFITSANFSDLLLVSLKDIMSLGPKQELPLALTVVNPRARMVPARVTFGLVSNTLGRAFECLLVFVPPLGLATPTKSASLKVRF